MGGQFLNSGEVLKSLEMKATKGDFEYLKGLKLNFEEFDRF